MHWCICDCGLYDDCQRSRGGEGDTIHCWKCGMTVLGEVPGGMIQSIEFEDDALVANVVTQNAQTENEEEEETL